MNDRDRSIQRLMQSLYRMARCRQAMFQDILSEYGVTLHQFHLLLHVKSCGSIKLSELSQKMLVSMPTASRMISALCETGLAERKKNDRDRRSTYLALTPRGSEVVEQIKRRQLETLRGIIGGIPQSDLEAFLRVAESIADEWTRSLRKEEEEEEARSAR